MSGREVAGARLVADPALCDAHGICVLMCPGLISLDEWGYAVIDGSPIEGRPRLRAARRAVRACPERALSIAHSRGSAAGLDA